MNGPEGAEYKGYETEGLRYNRYKLEGFKHLGYSPRRAKFEGTTGGDVKDVKNESQRLVFELGRETQGRYAHPAIMLITYTHCWSPQSISQSIKTSQTYQTLSAEPSPPTSLIYVSSSLTI